MYIGDKKIVSQDEGTVIYEDGSKNIFSPRVIEMLKSEESVDASEIQDKIQMLVCGELQTILLDYDLTYRETQTILQLLLNSINENKNQGIARKFGKKYFDDITFSDIDISLKS